MEESKKKEPVKEEVKQPEVKSTPVVVPEPVVIVDEVKQI